MERISEVTPGKIDRVTANTKQTDKQLGHMYEIKSQVPMRSSNCNGGDGISY